MQLLMQDGTKRKVIGQNGKFWFCEGENWRKSNPFIVKVIETKKKGVKENAAE